MTLTRILPSLRRSIPDPLETDAWPELSHATTTDVFVSGVSLLRIADLCGTPSVHTAAAVLPCTGGRPSSTERAGVVVTRVTGVTSAADGTLRVSLDARLEDARLDYSETRLLGRASTAKVILARLSGAGECQAGAGAGELDGDIHDILSLPGDLSVGDLLAIPCRGALTMADVNSFDVSPTEANLFQMTPTDATSSSEFAGGCIDLEQIDLEQIDLERGVDLERGADEGRRTPGNTGIAVSERWLTRLG